LRQSVQGGTAETDDRRNNRKLAERAFHDQSSPLMPSIPEQRLRIAYSMAAARRRRLFGCTLRMDEIGPALST
jgi:hypothetical protein